MNCFSKVNILNTLLPTIVLILLTINVKSQGIEEKAVQLFEEKNYTEALSHFEELNRLYPGENIFQYYYGVCLTETGRFGDQARRLLLAAAQGQVHANVFFYIGKNYHAMNDFETAEVYYKRFDNYSRRRDKRAVNFNEIMTQLANRENPFITQTYTDDKQTPVYEGNIVTAIDKITDDIVNSENETNEDKTAKIKQETVTVNEIPEPLQNNDIHFILTPEIKYLSISQFKTSNGLEHFISGWVKSNELQNTMQLLEAHRKKYNNVNEIEKREEIAEEMLKLELHLVYLKDQSDNSFLKSRTSEMEFWSIAPSSMVTKLNEENDSIQKITALQTTEPVLNKVIDVLQDEHPADIANIEEEPEEPKEEPEAIDTKHTEAIGEQISISTGKLVYKIQIGAYSRDLPGYVERQHSRLSAIRRIESYTTDKGVVVYTIGELTNFDDAVRLQNQIRQEGINDAFVVAFYNGKRITLSEAREIEAK